MKKIYALLFCIIAFVSNALCQQVISAEYFFDTDPGIGNGTVITFPADSNVSINNIPINVTGLPVGYHRIYLRVKDSNNVWSHYQQARFYVYNNSPIIPSVDTTKLVQAEYWIDTIATPGTGNLITLNPKDTLFYNDSIPGLQLDSGGHVVSLRVKDSKGFWSYIKTDSVRVEFYEVDISIQSNQFIRRNKVEKFEVSIKNRGNKNLYDLFLVVNVTKVDSIIILPHSDEFLNFDVDSVDRFSVINNEKYAPLWIYELPANSEMKFTLYLKFSDEINRKDQLVQEIGIYLDVHNMNESPFLVNGDTSMFISSKLFSIFREAMYQERDSTLNFYIADSTLIRTLDIEFKKVIPFTSVPILYNKLAKIILSNVLQTNYTDIAISKFNITSLRVIRHGNYTISEEIFDENTNNIQKSVTQCPPQQSPCQSCHTSCESPIPPLQPVSDFWFSNYECIKRCYCICCNNFWENHLKIHKGRDLGINIPIGDPRRKNWNKHKQPILAMYKGLVIHAGPFPGFGYAVIIRSCLALSTDSFTTLYGHISPDIPVNVNDFVEAGDTIGYVSNSGTGTEAPHLHIEFRDRNGKLGTSEEAACHFINLGYIDKVKDKDGFGPHDELPCPVDNNNEQCKIEKPESCDNEKEYFGKCNYPYDDLDCTIPLPVNPLDPNDKVGNEGFAPQRFIKPTDELHYGIFFENVDSATAPAQIVKIIDTLDLSKVDPSTFKLESVTAGEMLVVIPDSVQLRSIDTIYQAEAINGTFVDIKQSLDTLTGIIQFMLSSLDTINLQPVTGALEGFLPPDTSKFHGNGLVSYRIMPKANIANGTVINNTAYIVFDTNPPIATGTWFNTIDGASPNSSVDALAPETHDTSFVVSWSGNDIGAGISGYDVYYKTLNDTIFTKWLNYTTSTVDTFQGKWDSTYQFYSIAYDSVGNAESIPVIADASTKLTKLPLPITLKNFFVNEYNCTSLLSWTTSQEINASHVDIYKKEDNTNSFTKLATVQSVGNSSQEKMYSYIDEETKSDETYAYYLKFIDIDGKAKQSEIRTLSLTCDGEISSINLFPNPAKNELNVLYVSESNNSEIEIKIFDLTGRNLLSKTQMLNEGANLITFDVSNLSNGIYFLHYKNFDSMEAGSVKFEKR